MTSEIHGIHHAGILTRDLDALERTFTSFGFTLSPRSRHLLAGRPDEPPTLGCTANRCALFGGSYIELLGIVDESAPDPWHTKAMADESEGFRLLNLDTEDADATHRRLTDAGHRTSGVLALEREVDTAEGPRTVRARAVHLAPSSTPEGRIGVAQHLTHQYVHQPRHLQHPNGARGIASVLVVADDADFHGITHRYQDILRTTPEREGPLTVLSMKGGTSLRICRSSHAADVLMAEPVSTSSHLAALTVVVDRIPEARALVDGTGTTTTTTPDGGFSVSAHQAHGAGLFFTTGNLYRQR